MEIMKAVRGGEWNVNSNPVVVSVKYELVIFGVGVSNFVG